MLLLRVCKPDNILSYIERNEVSKLVFQEDMLGN